jgi:acyl dehydratase
VPDWPKTPVKPGDTAKIKVAFNSTNKKNKTTNTVTLTTNTEKGNEVVRIKAFVNPKKES